MLLLTAFEPFDGSGLNSSALALRLFQESHPRQIDGVALATAILPVSYGDDVLALERACQNLPEPPRAILHLGQTHAAEVAIEKRAVNLRLADSRRDWGTRAEHIPIQEGASPFLESTFPAEEIVAALRQAGVPCHASIDAGTFLCNHILFRSLQRAQSEDAARAVGFVHLPRLREQLSAEELEASEPPHLPLQVLARAIEVSARVIIASVPHKSENSASST